MVTAGRRGGGGGKGGEWKGVGEGLQATHTIPTIQKHVPCS